MKRLSVAPGLLVLGIAGFCASTAIAQESSVYKWVDSQGVPHFSDQPPMDRAAEEMAIRYRKTDRTALEASLKAKSELAAATEERENLASDADSIAKANRLKVLAEREANCKEARDRVAKYSTAQRLYKPGADGERVYLTSEELDVERANANRAVEQSCGEE